MCLGSVSMAICLGAPRQREHPQGMDLGAEWAAGLARARVVLLGDSGMQNVGKEQALGLPLQFFTSIQLPNCCFSPVLVGFTALCPPQLPPSCSLLCVPPGHGGAVLARKSQSKGPNTADSP